MPNDVVTTNVSEDRGADTVRLLWDTVDEDRQHSEVEWFHSSV